MTLRTSASVLNGMHSPSIKHQAKPRMVDAVVGQGFIPIFVNDALDSRRLVAATVAAGCRVLEYSCRRPDARALIPWIKREYPDLLVLAATLVDSPAVAAQLRAKTPGFIGVAEAVDLGADGLVSFLRFRPETYAAYGNTHLMIAGAGSPNEALDQLELGADLIKVTVSSVSGAELITKSRVPTHGCIPFFISGGLTEKNLGPYIKAGVVLTAAGFDMLLDGKRPTPRSTETQASAAITRMLAAVRRARDRHQPELARAIAANARGLLAAGPWHQSTPSA